MISTFCPKHKAERREAWEAYKAENDVENASAYVMYLATKAVETDDCEDGCGVIGLSTRGKIERLENPKQDWFLGHLLR